ncbi:hypothetical protein [Spongiactinospora gelatinilytica]|uniref:hypothetical protein n=1 Tax=Spongiactinospora gelatinilytica TaxID=2666298 RepID=UPI0018F4C904|nr:hypothetical protein [Spongiactinospora gelatinilytica]
MWCRAGDVEVPTALPGLSYKVSEASADYVRDMIEGYGALVVGRNQFDGMDGWGGQHPAASLRVDGGPGGVNLPGPPSASAVVVVSLVVAGRGSRKVKDALALELR